MPQESSSPQKKFTIYSRWDSTRVVFEREGTSLKQIVAAAVASGARLSGANLSGSDLSGSDLSDSNLSGSNLSGSNLRGARLSGADLRGARLSDSDLSGARLSGADLNDANLEDADLGGIKHDLWDVLFRAPREIPGLLSTLRDGRVDGSAYEGECACLVGTIANIAHTNYKSLYSIKPDASRPAERWFLAIRKGDMPDSSPVVRLTVEWVEEFTGLLNRSAALLAAVK